VCSFLWHLEFGLGEPTPAVKGYPHRVDEALRSLTKEENREFMPEEVSRWAATITAKFERDNWGVRTPNNNTTNNHPRPNNNNNIAGNSSNRSNRNSINNNNNNNNNNTSNAGRSSSNTTNTNTNTNNNNANNTGESEDGDGTTSAEDSEESDEDAAPAPAPAPAPIHAATAVAATATTPAFRLPRPNHPIWGTAGVMHGIYIRWQHGRRSYALDPRYAHQRRDAAVFGHNGLAPGDWWPLQIAAWFAGAHGSHIKGIFGTPTEGAYSVVVSGAAAAYHGENGDRDRGSVLFYSADSPDRNDVAAPSADTRALLRSEQTRRPVRVLRSAGRHNRHWAPRVGIRYDGLYLVERRVQTANGRGGHFWKFVLRRVAGQLPTLEQLRAVPSRRQRIDEGLVRDGY
jgi:hypothetical protein